jgi:hypothetical protein
MKVTKPPEKLQPSGIGKVPFRIFFAGSIEMGAAEDWQETLAEHLAGYEVEILNPRREHWDSSWVQSIDNETFREQVEWELSGLEAADLVLFFFDPATKSAISLLELGLYARSGKAVVYCPDGFWRKGNVDIVCTRYNIPHYDDKKQFVDQVIRALDTKALSSVGDKR